MDFYAAIQQAAGSDSIKLQSLAHFDPRNTNKQTLKRTYEEDVQENYHTQNWIQSRLRGTDNYPKWCFSDYQNTLNSQSKDFESRSGKYDTLLKQHTTLHEQHERLKKDFVSLSEVAQMSNDQSSQTKHVAKEAQESKLELISRHSKVESKLQEQLQEAQKCKADLIAQNLALREQVKGIGDAVDALNSRHSQSESKLQEQLQEAQKCKADLIAQNLALSEQVKGIGDAMNTLNVSYKAMEDKLILQSQLHSDKLKLLEVTHNTLKDRCKTLAASEEQHRVNNVLLEDRNKSITKDMEIMIKGYENYSLKDKEIVNLKALVANKEKDISHLQSLVDTKDSDIGQLKSLLSTKDRNINILSSYASDKYMKTSEYDDMIHLKEEEISSLKSKIDSTIGSHEAEIRKISAENIGSLRKKDSEISSLSSRIKLFANENKILQSKLVANNKLLKSHPIDPCLYTKTNDVIQSSAEILKLACKKGSVDSMRQCLGQVGDVLHDLNDQWDTHHHLCNKWVDQVKIL